VEAIATIKKIAAHEAICVGDAGNDGVAKVSEQFMLN